MKILKRITDFFILKDYQDKIRMTLQDFGYILLFKICIAYISLIIGNLLLLYVCKVKVGSPHSTRSISDMYYSAVVLAPILEELLFRLPLLIISVVIKKLEMLVMISYVFISMVFGLIHVTNYSNFSDFSGLEMLLITLPQILAGFVLGWVCLKYKFGLLWCILLHASFNFIAVSLSVLL